MRFVIVLLGLTLLILSQDVANARVYLGNEVLAMRGYETLRGKRVGDGPAGCCSPETCGNQHPLGHGDL